MTTTPAMPELPEGTTGTFYEPGYTADQMRAYALATLQAQPAAAGVSDAGAKYVEQIMEQAQVFASAWSLVGGRFDFGNALNDAYEAKDELRALVTRAILALRPQAVPMMDEQALGYWKIAAKASSRYSPAEAYYKGIADAEAHHGITAPAGGEGK